MMPKQGITVMNFEFSLCSKCNCLTKSVKANEFEYFCEKCGHDKMLSDVMQYEAREKSK